MYRVVNLTQSTEHECDAIETIVVHNGQCVPVARDDADGFMAFKIVQVSQSEEYYIAERFAFEGHTLTGEEDYGMFEDIPDEDTEEEA